jgi:hypothetical protein
MAHHLHISRLGWREGGNMQEGPSRSLRLSKLLVLVMLTAVASVASARPASQEPPQQSQEKPIISEDKVPSNADVTVPAPPVQDRKAADGQRHGLPVETYGVAPGTKFLVSLDEDLGTQSAQEKDKIKFKVKTLEPLEAGSGIYLPSGAEIRGHISHVESAGMTGRAKLWLTFDEIQTGFGRLPIVAEVVAVPGDHTVRCPEKQEGLIEMRTSSEQDAAEAAAAAAALGAVKGVRDKNAKEAAEGAALAALTAYIAESGRGHELQLAKGTKLELELERALYLVRE